MIQVNVIVAVLGIVLVAACSSAGQVDDSDQAAPGSTSSTLPPVDTQDIDYLPAKTLIDLEPILDHVIESAEPRGGRKGYIISEVGEQCWFVQGMLEEAYGYFFDSGTGFDTALMLFDKSDCMTAETAVGMEWNQRMVNTAISRWYSLPDAAFGVKPSELSDSAFLMARGWCMQSVTYPTKSVLIDYFVNESRNLVAVVHTAGVGGCE